MSELKLRIYQLAEKYHWQIKETRTGIIYGTRDEIMAENNTSSISASTIQVASISPINRQIRVTFECQLNISNEFLVEKTGFLRRFFSNLKKEGVFLIDVKSDLDYHAILSDHLLNEEWSSINMAKISAKNGQFILIASSYHDKNLSFVFDIIEDIIDSSFYQNLKNPDEK